ncbi:amidohydrolase [Pontibacillus halophilus JSM 076056 = DSM 19796]|uniref:Amidohydrolase n=1 Tax=Pontibacillus halophilus JSM 076056 = DSM 19796 TaxID=1385510 RepID=A0A0A5IBX7_9BACI|nr:amidohydrolase [Pontibacillus halophilus]KGX93347.1 amidohydrolase [Pontibacillus halophilus JSM 076056 = DSM 19796]
MGELWYGGTIYTMSREGETVESVYVKDGRIEAVGELARLEQAYKSDIHTYHNLNGSVMYPGFVDSHLHLIGHGERLRRLDLTYMTSAEEVLDAVATQAQTLKEGDWVIGEGWNENAWSHPRIIHKRELDEVVPNHPVVLKRVCRHAIVSNSEALRRARITREIDEPQGGKIERDEGGEPSGYLHDAAQELVFQAMPEVNQAYLQECIQVAVQNLHRRGLVGGHTEDLHYYGGFQKTRHAYLAEIHERNKFKAHLLVHHEELEEMTRAQLGFKEGTQYVEMGAVKLFSDGALGGRTAWLSEDYADHPGNKGVAIHSIEELERIVKKARTRSLPVAVHAIGDAAVDAVMTILEREPLQVRDRRDRIIHAQVMRPELYKRMKELEVAVDIQPTFVSSDYPWVLGRLGKERGEKSYPWKTMLDYGIKCAGGSDAPIEEVDPLLGIQAAVLRRSTKDGKVYGMEERLTAFEAVSLYTTGSAYIINEEHQRGKIAKSYEADFTVLDRDLFAIPPETIKDARVRKTVVNGDIVYDAFSQ